MEPGTAEEATFEGADGRRLVVVFAIITLFAAIFFASSLIDAYTDGTDGMANMNDTTQGSTIRSIGVEAFSSGLASSRTFVLHVGTSGQTIPGTDASIDPRTLSETDLLPRDLNTRVLLYGDTGATSKAAAKSLSNAGYRRVAYLDGGTATWVAAGRALE